MKYSSTVAFFVACLAMPAYSGSSQSALSDVDAKADKEIYYLDCASPRGEADVLTCENENVLDAYRKAEGAFRIALGNERIPDKESLRQYWNLHMIGERAATMYFKNSLSDSERLGAYYEIWADELKNMSEYDWRPPYRIRKSTLKAYHPMCVAMRNLLNERNHVMPVFGGMGIASFGKESPFSWPDWKPATPEIIQQLYPVDSLDSLLKSPCLSAWSASVKVAGHRVAYFKSGASACGSYDSVRFRQKDGAMSAWSDMSGHDIFLFRGKPFSVFYLYGGLNIYSVRWDGYGDEEQAPVCELRPINWKFPASEFQGE